MASELNFPPHVRGRRDDCPECAAIVRDNPRLKDLSKIFDLCEHSDENYHALRRVIDGIKSTITYVCQEPGCMARSRRSA